MDLQKLVYEWPTKHKMGFITPEIDTLLAKFEGKIHKDKWDDAMMGHTCGVDEEDGLIIYHCDILMALKCALGNRYMTLGEWD